GAAEVRQYAGQVLAALASGETPAAARDERRTASFLCLALVALGRRDLVREEWAAAAFGEVAADRSVTGLQRTLWVLAARGGLAGPAAAVVAGRLGVLTRPVDAAKAPRSWLGLLAAPGGVGETVLKNARIGDQTSAARQLGTLRAAVERIAGDQTVREPSAAVLRADEALGTGKADAGATDDPAAEDEPAVVDTLRLLIGEGSEPERALLARVAELRAQLTGDARRTLSAAQPAGAGGDLLAGDLRGERGPHLAAFALRLVGPAVLGSAEELHARATGEAPGSSFVRAEGQVVEIGAGGPDRQSLTAAEATLRETGKPVVTKAWYGAIAVAVVALAGGVALAFVHWFWLVVALAVAGFAARAAWKDRSRRRAEQQALDERVARLHKAAETAAGELTSYRDGQAERVRTADEDLDAIRTRLTDG
ncbi:MAG TPA: hypothetical protein VGJ44_28480, partial [Kribbellaceae bacterium]